ncbi:MAG: nucleotidyltransferase domain-containing protein [Lachnospiraceae bacterium]|nr:nucleotidyltransferase domain-containing protein [Lachnospiraceae bacterium]
MVQIQEWMTNWCDKLQKEFGPRLLFVGLQGSYLRGEATEESDLDVAVVLDSVSLSDLAAYRSLLTQMPEQEKACGFLCGREEFAHWPKYEIFQFVQGTKAWYGTLDGLAPEISGNDILSSLSIQTGALYHALCHHYIYGCTQARPVHLAGYLKSMFFLLQLKEYLRSGRYYQTKRELANALTGQEEELLRLHLELISGRCLTEKETEVWYERLLDWTSQTLRTCSPC